MPLPYAAGQPLRSEQVRAVDAYAVEHLSVPGIVLMENAARGVADAIAELQAPGPNASIAILCGPGNNGGDGLALARLLTMAGYDARVVLAADPDRLAGDAKINWTICERLGIGFHRADTDPDAAIRVVRDAAVIVDALLGTGAAGQPRGAMAWLIEEANRHSSAVRIAVDIPTGLNADTGQTYEPCFQAQVTVTLFAAKPGLLCTPGSAAAGRVVVAGIGIPRTAVSVL